jgi:hypothetical protein
MEMKVSELKAGIQMDERDALRERVEKLGC